MKRKKILWLVSWYPNRKDAFDGDFIQRHARAAAIYHDIHVIFVTPDHIQQKTEEVVSRATGLTEQVIYYKPKKGLASKILNHFTWKQVFMQAAENYISKNGKPDLVHVQVPWKAGIIALHLKNYFQVPYLITEHWGIYNTQAPDHFSTQPVFLRRYLKRIFSEAARILTVSKYAAEGLSRYLPVNKVDIIPNVVDSTLFTPRQEKYDRFSFIHVSNMAGLKNVGFMLEAFASFLTESGADAQFILIGDRDDTYRKKATELGLFNRSVFFRGEISYREVAEEMSRCHCFVIFSDTETFSCVTAEALCSGLPVIAARAGALPELVDENSGILVNPRDKMGLKSAMDEVFREFNRFDRNLISANAREKFNYSAVASQFNSHYEKGP
jgi:glycosyltransferase involved in cell wall biosynthesis